MPGTGLRLQAQNLAQCVLNGFKVLSGTAPKPVRRRMQRELKEGPCWHATDVHPPWRCSACGRCECGLITRRVKFVGWMIQCSEG